MHDRVMATSLPRFLMAAVMFATYLFVFRVLSWRTILSGAGTKIAAGGGDANLVDLGIRRDICRGSSGRWWDGFISCGHMGLKERFVQPARYWNQRFFLLANLLVAAGVFAVVWGVGFW